jgi:hypothetical protein
MTASPENSTKFTISTIMLFVSCSVVAVWAFVLYQEKNGMHGFGNLVYAMLSMYTLVTSYECLNPIIFRRFAGIMTGRLWPNFLVENK